MDLREMMIEKIKEEGIEEGLKEGIKRGIEKGKTERNIEILEKLITKMGMSDAKAANIVGVPVDFAKKTRRNLKK